MDVDPTTGNDGWLPELAALADGRCDGMAVQDASKAPAICE